MPKKYIYIVSQTTNNMFCFMQYQTKSLERVYISANDDEIKKLGKEYEKDYLNIEFIEGQEFYILLSGENDKTNNMHYHGSFRNYNDAKNNINEVLGKTYFRMNSCCLFVKFNIYKCIVEKSGKISHKLII